MALDALYQLPSGTLAALNAMGVAGQLEPGVFYRLTDDPRVALATSPTTYQTFTPDGGGGGGGKPVTICCSVPGKLSAEGQYLGIYVPTTAFTINPTLSRGAVFNSPPEAELVFWVYRGWDGVGTFTFAAGEYTAAFQMYAGASPEVAAGDTLVFTGPYYIDTSLDVFALSLAGTASA